MDELDDGVQFWNLGQQKDLPIKEEKNSRYDNGTYIITISNTNVQILAVIKDLEKFKLFVISTREFTLRTDCEEIVFFYHKKSKNKLFANRWLTFVDYIIGNGFNVTIEHINETNNFLADKLHRMIQDTYKNSH